MSTLSVPITASPSSVEGSPALVERLRQHEVIYSSDLIWLGCDANFFSQDIPQQQNGPTQLYHSVIFDTYYACSHSQHMYVTGIYTFIYIISVSSFYT
jgi:hypothetical protein